MSTPVRRDKGTDLAHRFHRMDRIFEEWMRSLPLRRPFGLGWDWPGEDLIRVDEFRDGETLVVRAELPGIDPDKDVQLTVDHGVLHIRAERRADDKIEDRGYTRHEMRHGVLTRSLPLPEGASPSDIAATCKNGILEVRIPVPARPPEAAPTTIPIDRG